MSTPLTKQELHNLAMNVVGKDLEEKGYEFLGVNSELQKDPQFVALKKGKLHFVLVRHIAYPQNPLDYDMDLVLKMKGHATKFNAKTFYAGVGIANSKQHELPVHHGEDYYLNYTGWAEI